MDCLAEKKQSLDFSADRPCSEFLSAGMVHA